jgi:hypothetical protein
VSDELDRRGAPRIVVTLVIAAIALTLGAIVTGFVIAARVGAQATAPQTGPLAVPAAPAPGESGRYCAQFMSLLPDDLAGNPRRALIAGTPGQAAWGDPAIILRCGLSDPAELTCGAPLTKFTGADGIAVEWLRTASDASVTYLAVDRPVRIAVTVPDSAGIGPVQQLSDLIGTALPARDVCSASGVIPADNS